MALDKKKVRKDLEALDEEDRGIVSAVLQELDGGAEGALTGEEITGLRDLLKKATGKKGKSFLSALGLGE